MGWPTHRATRSSVSFEQPNCDREEGWGGGGGMKSAADSGAGHGPVPPAVGPGLPPNSPLNHPYLLQQLVVIDAAISATGHAPRVDNLRRVCQ